MYCLAVDSGNSFLKWAIFENDQKLMSSQVGNHELYKLHDVWQKLRTPDTIIISQVSGADMTARLKQHFKIWNTQPYWISAVSKQCGVTNNYANPRQLGSDRWAALIAAWDKFHEACIVIDVGTAMTVDVLSSNGVFMGGIIIPGPYSLQKSIQCTTPINLSEEIHQYRIFPVNTADAIYSGIIQALVGSIERMLRLYKYHQGSVIKHCLISGGGLSELLPHIDFDVIVIDNLVVEGLLRIAKDLQLNQKM
ncbi:type III pantothenate kinase [Nitrosomonas sp. Nm51]|uniref:type III pantothenate kinase n=1 Tax=Nitrosomonas sp. Nm51 TaxID=133720 RepID=UPI0008ADE885|nr:type III pantothenate kinase [Nitrosomonas sp. Nm51]SER60742.1 type III pantothenate kinase [Nitrosomonas sp. Nm51]